MTDLETPQIDEPQRVEALDGSDAPSAELGADGILADSDQPMTSSLMARLFAVPLVIVSVIVGCAVLVVLLFGSIATDQERSIDDLLTILETRPGDKLGGVLLLPNEKELWQASRELALRLSKKEVEISPDELPVVVDRLSAILDSEVSASDKPDEWAMKKRHFVMQAVAKTESPKAVDALVPHLKANDPLTRGQALVSLADLHDLPEARNALGAMFPLLKDDEPAVQMQACIAVSVVAPSGDPATIEALVDAYFDDDREVQWNAALALARLGSSKSKSSLLDMLTRSYWENDVKVRRETKPGSFVEYPLPPLVVSRYLVAAVEAAAHVEDAEVWSQIELLAEDESPDVKEAVRRVREERPIEVGSSESDMVAKSEDAGHGR